MKVLIIDNGTKYLRSIKRLVEGFDSKIVANEDINLKELDDFSAAILSGGHDFPVVGNEDLLQDEIKLIRTFKGPVLGICFGFELIAYTYDAEMKELPGREKGVIKIDVVEKNEIFLGLDDFEVFENHRWVVKKLSDGLLALAESKDGFESIKHKDRPIYGVQFHPEMFVANEDGEIIFNNFINLAK